MGASVAIEAAQSRPPSSLAPSDFADLGSAKTTFACCACAPPPSPCCMTWQFRQPAVFCQCGGGGDTPRCCGESCSSLPQAWWVGVRFAPSAYNTLLETFFLVINSWEKNMWRPCNIQLCVIVQDQWKEWQVSNSWAGYSVLGISVLAIYARKSFYLWK